MDELPSVPGGRANVCSPMLRAWPTCRSPSSSRTGRSIAMLPVGAPALNRDEALELLRHLAEALREPRRRNDGERATHAQVHGWSRRGGAQRDSGIQ
jgi:hypothetical protein